MTLVASGVLSIGGTTANRSINLELDRAQDFANSNLNETAMRTLADKASGTIGIGDFYSKTNRKPIALSYTGNTADVTVTLSSLAGYLTGKTDVTITVGSGVYIYSNGTGNAALTITGASTGDTVNIINNGYIIGRGGTGGGFTQLYNTSSSAAPVAGGPALSCGCLTTITNNGYICGGGGGGGAGIPGMPSTGITGGGGGAGGGDGGTTKNTNNANTVVANGTGGGGGGLGGAGSNGVFSNGGSFGSNVQAAGGGGGGRVVSSTATGGAAQPNPNPQIVAGTAFGLGGQAGGSGGTSTTGTYMGAAGGGGGWGATGGSGLWNSRTGTNSWIVGPTTTSGAGGGGNAVGGDGTQTGHTGTFYYYGGGLGGSSILKNSKSVTISSGATRIYGDQV